MKKDSLITETLDLIKEMKLYIQESKENYFFCPSDKIDLFEKKNQQPIAPLKKIELPVFTKTEQKTTLPSPPSIPIKRESTNTTSPLSSSTLAEPPPSSPTLFTTLERPEKPVTFFKELQNQFQTIFPHTPLKPLPSQEELAKLTSPEKSNNIIILFDTEPSEHKMFLEKLTKALCDLHYSCKLHSIKEMQQNELKTLLSSSFELIIVCNSVFHKHKELFRLNSQQEFFFNKTPLLVLADISIYLNDLSQKKIVWKSLKTKLKIASTK